MSSNQNIDNKLNKELENIYKEGNPIDFFVVPFLGILSSIKTKWVAYKPNDIKRYENSINKNYNDIVESKSIEEIYNEKYSDNFKDNHIQQTYIISAKFNTKKFKFLNNYVEYVLGDHDSQLRDDYPTDEHWKNRPQHNNDNNQKSGDNGAQKVLYRLKKDNLEVVKATIDYFIKTHNEEIINLINEHKEKTKESKRGKKKNKLNSESENMEKEDTPNNQPRNQILYGPPGTGKTFKLQDEYFSNFTEDDKKNYIFLTFHQSYAYEEFIEGIKPITTKCENKEKDNNANIQYCIKDGVFKKACKEALKLSGFNGTFEEFSQLPEDEKKEYLNEDTPKYAIFIDEINRGNISKIFGELITLVEDTKRLGAKDEITATLPYSEEIFGVPNNLYIIGTMNTADRSIAHIDTALRRRFEFVEMMPEYEKLEKIDIKGKDKEINIRNLLESMNDRIEVLYDREHTIGHSYFLNLNNDSTVDDLKHIFKNKIIPLLAEYFYSDWNNIKLVLNDIKEENNSTYKEIIEKKDIPKILPDKYSKKPTFKLNYVALNNIETYIHIADNGN